MAHIHTEPGQHDHTVTAFIIRVDGSEPKALLHMHRKLGRLLPIGGHIELNETPWQAMAHELSEESGYTLKELMILQPKHRITNLPKVTVHPYPVVMNTHEMTKDHFHSDTAYAFIATSIPLGSIADGESSDLRWVTYKELQSFGEAEIFLNTKALYTFMFDTCLKEWDKAPTSLFEL